MYSSLVKKSNTGTGSAPAVTLVNQPRNGFHSHTMGFSGVEQKDRVALPRRGNSGTY